MESFEKFLETRTTIKERRNVEDVHRQALEFIETSRPVAPWLEHKIDDYLLMYGGMTDLDSPYKVIAKMACDLSFCVYFRKPAKKQRIAEEAQIEYLRLKKLSNGSNNGIRLLNGRLIEGKLRKDDYDNATKAIDAINTITSTFFFIKHTSSSGGGNQDNIYKEAVKFLTEANSYIRKNPDNVVSFAAILDGDYFSTKLDHLRERFSNKRLIITTSDDYKRMTV